MCILFSCCMLSYVPGQDVFHIYRQEFPNWAWDGYAGHSAKNPTGPRSLHHPGTWKYSVSSWNMTLILHTTSGKWKLTVEEKIKLETLHRPISCKTAPHVHHEVTDVSVIIVIILAWNQLSLVQNCLIQKRKSQNIWNCSRMWYTCK